MKTRAIRAIRINLGNLNKKASEAKVPSPLKREGSETQRVSKKEDLKTRKVEAHSEVILQLKKLIKFTDL